VSGALDPVTSIKVKLGALVAASVVVAALLGTLGSGAGVPALLTLPVAVALALGVTQLLAAGMVAPLREMTDVAQRMARGDYSGRVRTTATDEVGRLAVAFNRMAADLEQVDAERRDLVATVSHELRTPLASIIGYTELLQDLPDEDLSPTARRLVGVVERNAARELRLVDDLLTLAFLGEGRMPVALGPVDLGEIVRGAAETGRTPARRRGLTLEVQDAGVAPVQGDAQRLGQVVDNLLTNAVKFTPPGGRVVLRVLDDGDAALLEVADTGPGVPAEDLERIFERLYRSEAAVRGQVPGAGLGLPIVRAIIEAHGGRVEATSEPGAGTVVRARVPYVPRLSASTTAEASTGP
jgi:two-component system, OmpR family, sensor histidine kinase BaeS